MSQNKEPKQLPVTLIPYSVSLHTEFAIINFKTEEGGFFSVKSPLKETYNLANIIFKNFRDLCDYLKQHPTLINDKFKKDWDEIAPLLKKNNEKETK